MMDVLEVYFLMLIIAILTLYFYKRLFNNRLWGAKNLGTNAIIKDNENLGTNAIIKDNENYIRLLTCFNFAGRRACLEVIFNNGLSRNKKQLYQELLIFRNIFSKLKTAKHVSKKQFDLLYPTTQETDYDEFDITLLYQVIRNCSTLQQPMGGWKIKTPRTNDGGVAACVIHLKEFRNKLSHYGDTKISDVDFKALWDELMNILAGLNYQTNNVKDLEYCPLDTTYEYKNAIFKAQIDFCADKVNKTTQDIESIQNRYDEFSKMNALTKDNTDVELEIIKGEIEKLKIEIENPRFQDIYQVVATYNKISKLQAKMNFQTRQLSLSLSQLTMVENTNQMNQDYSLDTINLNQAGSVSQQGGNSSVFRETLSFQDGMTLESVKYLTTQVCNSDTYMLDRLILGSCNLTDSHILILKDIAPRLSNLHLNDNECITAAAWKRFADEICNNTTCRLSELSLESCNIGDKELVAITNMIPLLTILSLSNNKCITPIGLKYMARAIKKTTPFLLEKLVLSHCNASDAHLSSLSYCIAQIKCVDLEYNKGITAVGLDCIAKTIKNEEFYLLKEIDLSNCNLNDTHLQALLIFQSSLTVLRLSGVHSITECGWRRLSIASYEKGNSLRELWMADFVINNENIPEIIGLFVRTCNFFGGDIQIDVKAIAHLAEKYLKVESFRTKFLYISYDCHYIETILKMSDLNIYVYSGSDVTMKPTALSILLEVILSYPKQQFDELRLPQCNLGDTHMKDVAKSLYRVHSLVIQGNKNITPDGFNDLANIPQNMDWTWHQLDISECNITDNHLEKIQHIIPYVGSVILQSNKRMSPVGLSNLFNYVSQRKFFFLHCVDLSSCNLTDSHIKSLKSVIQIVKTIVLDGNNMITPAGWSHISDAITSASRLSLQSIGVEDCAITPVGLSALLQGAQYTEKIYLCRNKSIEPLTRLNATISPYSTLSTINLSQCNLTDTVLVTVCQNLPSVKSIDVSLNTTLTVNCLNKLSNFLSNNKAIHLDHFSLNYCGLTDKHLEAVSVALLSVERLTLEGNKRLTGKGFQHFSKVITFASFLRLQEIDISECNITKDHLQNLRDLIPLLKKICLNRNETLNVDTLKYISSIITSANILKLEEVELSDCNLTDAHLQAFRNAVPYLKTVSFSFNDKITEVGLQFIASETLYATSNLERVNLTDCDLRNPEIAVFGDPKSSVTSLSLADNSLLIEDASLYEPYISNIIKLDKIDFSCKNMKDNSIAQLKPLFPLIDKLDLSEQKQITSVGFTTIKNAVIESSMRRISSLSLVDCHLIDEDLIALSQVLPYLQQFDISCNKTITPTGYKFMSDAVSNSSWCCLEEVTLKNCHIKDQDMQKLGGLVSQVKYLDLSENKFISEEGWECLSERITKQDNFRLNTLVLQNCNLNISSLKALKNLILLLTNLDIGENFTLASTDYTYLSNAIFAAEQSNLDVVALPGERTQDIALQSFAEVIPMTSTLSLEASIVKPTTLPYTTDIIKRARYSKLDTLDVTTFNLLDQHFLQLINVAHLFRKIDLSDNRKGITADTANRFSSHIIKLSKEHGSRLDIVQLGNCGINDEKLERLHQFIPTIEMLDLSRNPTIQPRGLSYIGDALETSCGNRLQSLSLSDCNLNEAHLKALGNLLPLLNEIIFDENRLFGRAEFEYLSSMITNHGNINLESISFKNCNVGDENLALMHNLILRMKEVDLSGNRSISAVGLKHFSKSLVSSNCCCLEYLALESCNIEASKLEAIYNLIPMVKISLKDNSYLEPQTLSTIFGLLKQIGTSALENFPLNDCLLTDDHIKEIAMFIPSLTKLNLSNQKLITPAGIKIMVNAILSTSKQRMRSISLHNSGLTDEHVGELCHIFPFIQKIDLGSNQFFTGNSLTKIVNKTSSVTKFKLVELNLSDINCNKSHINAITKITSHIKSMSLIMDNNKTLSTDCLKDLSLNITRSKTLERLSIKDCNLREHHLQAISKMVPNVEDLDISNNKLITAKGLQYLSHAVCAAEKNILKKIFLRDCNVKEKELEALSNMVPLLKEIDLSCNKTISPIGIRRFSTHLHSADSTKLEKVILQDCNLNHSHFEAMEILTQKIKHLDISGNRNMTSKDLKKLSFLASSDKAVLKSIDFSNCNLNDCQISVILPTLSHLEKIVLSRNRRITHTGLKNLSKVLRSSKISSLQVLKLSDCNLNGKAIEVLSSLTSSLMEIDLSKNKLITVSAITNFAECLCNASQMKLEIIDLSDCHLTDAHLISLSSILTMLKKLVLNNNKSITYKGLRHASDVLEERLIQYGCLNLREVHLQDCGPEKSWEKFSKWNVFFKILI